MVAIAVNRLTPAAAIVSDRGAAAEAATIGRAIIATRAEADHFSGAVMPMAFRNSALGILDNVVDING